MRLRLWLMAVLLLSVSAHADYRAKTRMTVGGHSFDSTMMVKGSRQRSEMQMAPGMNMVTIYQCDQNRSIQLNDRTKTYMISKDAEASDDDVEGPSSAKSAKSKRGGVVTITNNLTETGEKKQLFGHTAREIKMNMSVQASPGSCTGANTKMSSDGWYIDLPVASSCASPERAAMRMRAQQSRCQDQFVFKNTGSAKLGFPVSVTTTIEGQNGQPTTFTQETLDLSTTTLDDKLFDIPAGYRQVNSYAQMMGMGSMADMIRQAQQGQGAGTQQEDMTGDAGPRAPEPTVSDDEDENTTRAARPAAPKKAMPVIAGAKVKIGVAVIADPNNSGMATSALRDHLMSSLQEMGAEVVPLDENSKDVPPETIAQSAKAKQCDYFLLTEVATASKAAAATKKFGGMLGRATGLSSSNANSDFGVKYQLFATPDPKSRLVMNANTSGESPDKAAPKALEREASAVMEQVAKERH